MVKAFFTKYIWRFLFFSIVGVVLLFSAAAVGLLGEMPSIEDLEQPPIEIASEVISDDGVLLGKYYFKNRSETKPENISPYLYEALVATEDYRFYEHSGIDFYAIARAIVFFGKRGGGSSITQQLALNLFAKREKSRIDRVKQKIKEWVIAARLERRYTKKEILAMYLNTVPFGGSVYGIKTASKTFFNKSPAELNMQESSTLIGLLVANSYYNPVKYPDRSKLRRNVVLGQVKQFGTGIFTHPQLDSIAQLPLVTKYTREVHSNGLATYFRENLRMELQKWANEVRKPDGSKYNIYKDGLKIYTTLDSRMQEHAEQAMESHMKEVQKTFFEHWKKREYPWDYKNKKPNFISGCMKRSERYRRLKEDGLNESEILQNFKTKTKIELFSWNGPIDSLISPYDSIIYANYFLHPGMMSMEVQTGKIKAWVGGTDISYFQYDHVNSTAKRQVGSTFKPFVYAKAIINHWEPCALIPNERVTIDNWSPENADGKYGGFYTCFSGLAKSVNCIVAYLMKNAVGGAQEIVDLARRMGITSDLQAVPSICLGTFDISVIEMVGAYGTFANKGTWTKPIFINRIEDSKGNILLLTDALQPRTRDAIDAGTAYTMCKIMQGTCKSGGTGQRIRDPKNGGVTAPLAAKTGTTQDNSDGWFIAYSPELVTGAWVGADSRHVAFRSTAYGQGAYLALPMVGKYLGKVFNDPKLTYSQSLDFDRPKGNLPVELNCGIYNEGRVLPNDTIVDAGDIFN